MAFTRSAAASLLLARGLPEENLRPTSVSLVIPAYNEEENIVDVVHEARKVMSDLAVRYEILVVDDGSDDTTAASVKREFGGNGPVRLLRHPQNIGYGAALRSGFSAARFDLVAFTDADGQFHLEDLGHLLVAINGYDAACGYRVDRQDPPLRLIYSAIYNFLVRSLLGLRIRDCDCALKVFRRSILAALPIRAKGFLINAEVLARLKDRGASIVEVGVRHRPRLQGRSTVSPLHALPVLAGLLTFWWSECWFPEPELGYGRVGIPFPEGLAAQENKRVPVSRGRSVQSS